MKKILLISALAGLVAISSGCIKDTYSTEYASSSQIGTSGAALNALSNATSAFMYAYDYFGTMSAQEFGYPAMMIMRDALTDCPYVSTNYNHFSTPWASLSDFSSSRSKQPWRYYYTMILNANNTISAVANPETAPANIQQFYGNALVYRAMSYMDLMRIYEYKKTGVAKLDAEADQNGVWGLTAVIVDEKFNDADADKNPRVPYYKMYRFIMNDLNRAERYLTDYSRPNKTKADLSVVKAYKARLWLEIATRFQKQPESLNEQIAHEDDPDIAMYDKLEITSAADCYRKAAEYAREAMSSYSPLTKAQWHSTTDGFNNSAANTSWLFAIMITSQEAVYSRVDNFYSNCVTEYSRGYSRSQYFCYRMIDKRLYDKIGPGDWRKATWIAPGDAGKKPTPSQYYTLLDADEWAKRNAYVGFKFRPKNGDISDDYKSALQVDFPVIRVEEMYFIEAEAKAYTEGLGAGVNALTSFMNSYRYTDNSYNINPTSVDDFVDNYLLVEKRIEFWGEGLSFFDIKRRELNLTRGYTGTNWLPANRFNSKGGFTPSWLNYYLPREGEGSLNTAVVINPDPSVLDSYGLWTE